MRTIIMMSLAAPSCDMEGNHPTGRAEDARPKRMEFGTGLFYDTHLRYLSKFRSQKP